MVYLPAKKSFFGTDPSNSDSDYDGVSDGNEVKMMYFPNEADSDFNGVLDGDEDYDEDGIINRDEESYGTFPYLSDSDFDEINDYDELFTYGTNPNNDDSDGDYILDGDELILGLDPSTDTTEGGKDNENTQEYSFTSTSEQIAEYNTDDQPFSFSFDITSAGCVDKYIKVQETGYKYAIADNTTILGKSPEIVYDDNMKTDSVTVSFTMKNGYEADIDKYCVYYWEGYNILIPIETEYDYDTGTVYATNSMIGTYCLVDTDQMYDLLGVEETTESSTSFASDYPVYNMLSSTDTTDINYSTSSVYEFNGHEYVLIVADTPLSYLDAVEVCAKEGGYPAVITSDEENGFLYDLRGGLFASCWLGGLVIREGRNKPTVQWITGEECVYTCWGSLYYSGIDGTLIQGLTYEMNGWCWVDLDTRKERRVICERPVGSNPDEEGITISALTFGEEDIGLNCYSDSDIDGDGLLDYEELSECDLGAFDSTTGVYTPANLDVYYNLAEGEGMNLNSSIVKKTGKLKASACNTDLRDSDKDRDTYLDSYDASPLEEIEDVIYVLYDPNNFEDEAGFWKKKYINIERVFLFSCYSNSGFKNSWYMMGIDSDGKWIYNIDKVYLLFHGQAGCFGLADKTSITIPPISYGYDCITELNYKPMNQLILNICQSGNSDYDNLGDDPASENSGYLYNLATGFAYFHPEIKEVVGWNGYYYYQCTLFGFNEYASKEENANWKDDSSIERYGWIYRLSADGSYVYKTADYKATQTGYYDWYLNG